MNREDQIKKEIADLQDEREKLRANKQLMCDGCGKRSQIKKWIVIRNYHYIRPYSCSGGDYWTDSEDYNLVCPKCGSTGRVYMPSWVAHQRRESKPIEEHFLCSDRELSLISTFEFVHSHIKYFGERLSSYDDGNDVEVLRAIKKKKEDDSRNNEMY